MRWKNPPDHDATPEPVFRARRRFLRQAGFAGVGALALGCGKPRPGLRGEAAIEAALAAHRGAYPARRNTGFALDRPLTTGRSPPATTTSTSSGTTRTGCRATRRS